MSTQGANGGRWYWCVVVPESISSEKKIYLHADSVLVLADGSLAFLLEEQKHSVLCMAPGFWQCYYAASVIDGSPCRVEHWAVELVRDE